MKSRVKEFLLRQKEVYIVACIGMVHVLVTFNWLKLDNFPLWFDFGGYYKRSIDIFYASQKGWVDFSQALQGIGNYQGTFYPYRLILPLFSLPWYYFFGLSADTAVMSCSLFLAISLFSVYAIASKLFDKATGVLAAFILSTSPAFFIYLRRYDPHPAVMALAGLSACLFLYSQNFQKRVYSVLFGISLGLSMLAKELSFVFIFGIVIYALYKIHFSHTSLPDEDNQKKKAIKNFIISLCIAGVIVFPLYWLYRQKIFLALHDSAFSNAMRQKYNMPVRFGLEGMAYYSHMMFNFGISPLHSVFFILGLYLYSKTKVDNKGFLVFWLFSSYVLLSSAQTKVWYYGIPLLIPIVLITSYGANTLFKSRKARFLLILFIVSGGIQNLLVYSFPVFEVLDFSHWKHEYDLCYPVNEDWKLEEIIDYIMDNRSDGKKEDIFVHVGPNLHAFSPMTFDYVAAEKRLKLRFAGAQLPIDGILQCDFVIVKSGNEQGIFYSSEQAQMTKDAVITSSQFIKLQRIFSLPDGSEIEIYKKISL